MNPMTHAEALKALFLEGTDLDLTDRHAAQYALGLAERIERTAQELIDSMTDGNDAMRAVADEPPFSDEPFTDQLRQTIAARKAPKFKVGDRVRINPDATSSQYRGEGVIDLFDGSDHMPYRVEITRGLEGFEQWVGSRWFNASELSHADSIPVATPAEDEQLDEIKARQVEAAHPAPNFAPLDMVSFAGDLARSLGKGA